MTNSKIYTLLLTFFTVVALYAQTPEKINYQAVARDLSGLPISNQSVSVVFEVRQGSASGTDVYKESHTLMTNQFGLFSAEIGGGTVLGGAFNTINWGTSSYYLYIEVDGSPIGASQLLSVPYALYSKESANGPTGAQGPPGVGINWLGTLTAPPPSPSLNDAYYNSTSGQSFIWDGASWKILAQDGTVGSLTGGVGINVLGNVISNTGDLDSTNELQNLSTNGNNIDISNGTGTTISATAPVTGDYLYWNGLNWVAQTPVGNTDNQDLSLSGNTLSLTNDATPVDLSPYLDNTDAQTLSYNSGTQNLVILGGNTVTLIVDDADNDPNNERITTFGLNGTSDSLIIVESGVGHAFPLSDLNDGDWTKAAPNKVFNTTDLIGIGTNNPTEKLHIADGDPDLIIQDISGLGNAMGATVAFKDQVGASVLDFGMKANGPTLTSYIAGENISFQNNFGSGVGTRLFISGSNGYVGLGTLTPNSNLDVQASGTQSNAVNVNFTSTSTAGANNGIFSSVNNTAGGNIFSGYFQVSGSNSSISSVAVKAFNTANSTLNTGLETSATGTGSTNYGVLSYASGATNNWAGYFGSGAAGDGKVYVQDNLSVGTTSPSYPFEVNKNQTGTTPLAAIINTNATGDAPLSFITTTGNYMIGTDGNTFKIANSSTNLLLNTRMTIGSTGNVGFGTTAPTAQVHANSVGNVIALKVVANGASTNAALDVTSLAGGPAAIFWNGNVGIGLSPTAKLHLSGTLRMENLGGAAPAVGAVLTSIDALGNAEWQPLPTLPAALWSGSAGVIYPTTITDKVGIGTTSPVSDLHIFGTQGIQMNAANATGNMGGLAFRDGYMTTNRPFHLGMVTYDHSSGGTGFSDGLVISGFDGIAFTTNNGALSNTTLTSVRMFIHNNGNVGVGTYTPLNTLDVEGRMAIGTNYSGNVNAPADGLIVQGNVGIGSASPGMIAGSTNYLTIASTGPYAAGSIASLELKGNTNSANSTAAKIDFLNGIGTNNTARIEVTTSGGSTGEGRMLFYTNGGTLTEKMRIDEDGNVGIGTVSPTALLSVNGTANKPGGGAWTVFSDARSKENVIEYKRGLNELLKLRPVSFNYKSEFNWGDKTYVGLIAQEVEKVVPTMVEQKEVNGIKDFREVDPNEINYMLINSIKEQQKMIEDLKQNQQKLEQEIQQLKNK